MNYYEHANIERLVWQNIKDRIFNTKKYGIYTYVTVADGTDHYDVLVQLTNKDTGNIIKTFFIEIKVRDTHYKELTMERYKYSKIKKIVDEHNPDADILYICTTPEGTFIFNVTKLVNENELGWFRRLQNKSTAEKHKGKRNKLVTDIPTEFSIHTFPLTTSDIHKQIAEQEAEKKRQEQAKTVKTNCIFGGKL